MAELNFTDYILDPPSLDELEKLFSKHLPNHFERCEVDVVDCPDLRKEPFGLVGAGFGGKRAIADIGGTQKLSPLPRLNEHCYSLPFIASRIGFKEDALIIGAACGPYHIVGKNCEFMPNIFFGKNIDGKTKLMNDSFYCKTINDDKSYICDRLDSSDICLLGNVFVTEGKPGKVIRINVKKRTSAEPSFSCILQKIVTDQYKDRVVSMGGVFLIKAGKANIHVMPDFSKVPLVDDQQVNNWLKYFDMEAPLVCLMTSHSKDPGLNLRMEHTHCFNRLGHGGHYHYDVTPDIVEYEAYIHVADKISRVDNPNQ